MARHRLRRPPRRPGRWVLLGVGTALLGLVWGTGGTLAAWTSGQLVNSADDVATGSLAVTHDYADTCVGAVRTASQACRATLTPTGALPATSATDSITNHSGRAITQSVSASSCGPVQLANAASSSNPLLPRFDIAFDPAGGPSSVGGSGAVALGSTGYATDTTSQTVGGTPGGLVSLGAENDYGYGVWFKTTATSGRLFGLASAPTNTPPSGTTTYDRTLSLSAGKLVFAAGGASSATSSVTVNDGSWHYAYVSLTSSAVSVLFLGLTVTTKATIYVDGTSVASSSSDGSLSTPTGYWSVGGGFAGSLSNFAVYNGTGSPTSPPAAPYAGATWVWPLDDNGHTTYSGSMPPGMAAPCTKVDTTLTFAGPAATIGPLSLDTLVTGGARTVAAPAAGATQTLTVATTQGNGYTRDLAGLHLYVPLTFTYGTSPVTSWTLAMQWAGDARDVFVA